jgi:class 3 adenylate cyclase
MEKKIPPIRVFAVSFLPPTTQYGQAEYVISPVYSNGIASSHRDFFIDLARFQLYDLIGADNQHLEPHLNKKIAEVLGIRHTAGFFCSQVYGTSFLAMNGKQKELMFWSHIIKNYSDAMGEKLPEKNYQLATIDHTKTRICGMIFFSIPADYLQNNPQIIANGYKTEDNHLEIVSSSGSVFSSQELVNYRRVATSTVTTGAENSDYLVRDTQISRENENLSIKVFQRIDNSQLIPLRAAGFILFLPGILLCAYVYISLYYQTLLTVSIRAKLLFSIFIAAIIPVLAVSFVIEFFLVENHRSLLGQQKLELQRYLDSFEYRSFYFQPLISDMLRNFSDSSRIISLAEAKDARPDDKSLDKAFADLFSGFLEQISTSFGWASNASIREAILISRKNWELFFNLNPEKKPGVFSGILVQMGKHILSRLGNQQSGTNVSLGDVKSEIFYESSMDIIRSNFGEEAYIRLTSDIASLVELEVTTGALGLFVLPLPSVDRPDYFLIWMVALSKGNYLARIAQNNRGAYAVFTNETLNYGKLRYKLQTAHNYNLEKMAAWITSSNQPVSEEKNIGSEKLTLEGGPGVHQINNFLIGAASQTPIDRITQEQKFKLILFLFMSIALFILVAIQTANDLVNPISSLREVMRQIDQHNYFYRICPDRQDELGELCRSYDRFAQGLAEKEIMGKMVSRQALIAAGNQTSASSKRSFAFIYVGSPGFAEKVASSTTAELFAQLQNHVTTLTSIITAAGGDIDKVIGDKILGVFAIDHESSQTTLSAVLSCARNIFAAEADKKLVLPVAFGVNAGEVISGIIGFGDKRDFTVIGDAVNVTARIQKQSEKLATRRGLFSLNLSKSLPQH